AGPAGQQRRLAQGRVGELPGGAEQPLGGVVDLVTERTQAGVHRSTVGNRPAGAGYRPLGNLIVSGATYGLPTSSWTCSCAVRSTLRGSPLYTLPSTMV